jgi:hypothetical protein
MLIVLNMMDRGPKCKKKSTLNAPESATAAVSHVTCANMARIMSLTMSTKQSLATGSSCFRRHHTSLEAVDVIHSKLIILFCA